MFARGTAARWPLSALALTVVCMLGCTSACVTPGSGVTHAVTVSAHTTVATADDGAKVVNQTTVAPRTVDLSITSPALSGTETVRLLLPPDWSNQPASRWPVLYLLHGCCDDYRSWTRYTDVAELSAHTDVLIVMPEAGPAGYYSNWLNGPAWETFHLVEVRQLLERDYRAGQSRAIAGLSMGGFGAMSYAALNPGMFKAVASYSGLLDTAYNQVSIAQIQGILSGDGHANPDALWGDPVGNADVWAAHNPYEHAGNLRGAPLYISSGTGEPGPLDAPGAKVDPSEQLTDTESTVMVAKLRQLGASVTDDLTNPGTHSWRYWQRALHASFPTLMQAIGAPTD